MIYKHPWLIAFVSLTCASVASVAFGQYQDHSQARDSTAQEQPVDKQTTPQKSHSRHGNDIVTLASEAGNFKTLVKAIQTADLERDLRGAGPFTLFAPTDEAFEKLPEGTVEGLMKDPPKLRAVLKYHVVSGKIPADKIVEMKNVKSLSGQLIPISTTHGVKVGDAKVLKTDLMASNGVIHMIDEVMMPKPDIIDVATQTKTFGTLLAAAKAANMLDALRGEGPMTLFAPTDKAFAKLPKGTVEAWLKDPPKLRAVLKYHVVPGKVTAKQVAKLSTAKTSLGQFVTIRSDKKVMIDSASVTQTDILAANGIIHVIDTVLMPKDDIVDVARKAGSFETLLTAIDAAGLTDTLRSEGPLTVFAPTDEAFAKLPEGALKDLLNNPAKLRSVLTYHVLPGRFSSDQLVGMSSVKTTQGQPLSLSTTDGNLKVNGASILSSDIKGANGLIHVIDQVMMPPPQLMSLRP